jgi:hypothetical protein
MSSSVLTKDLLPKVAVDLRDVFIHLVKNPCEMLRIEVIIILCLFALFVVFKMYIAWCIISTSWDVKAIKHNFGL